MASIRHSRFAQTQATHLSRRGASIGPHLCRLVGEESEIGSILSLESSLELREVTMVVSLHLEVEDLGLTRGSSGNKVIVEELQDGRADVAELLLDLSGAWQYD